MGVVNHDQSDGETAMINKDEAAGKLEQGKGVVKEKVGEWTGDTDLEAEGIGDQVAGKVREKTGTVERKVDETLDSVKKTLNR
jgi:uncharacterized protein YjbJ (UPF0337 family)